MLQSVKVRMSMRKLIAATVAVATTCAIFATAASAVELGDPMLGAGYAIDLGRAMRAPGIKRQELFTSHSASRAFVSRSLTNADTI